jgi:hypothetical protein
LSVPTLHHPALLGNDFGVHGSFFDSLIGNSLFINMKLPYKIASLVLVIIGTVLWGYGDLLVELILE